jgi:hypothetical protein
MAAHLLFKTSIIKFCQASIQAMREAGLTDECDYINFDAHSQIDKLPTTDLVGHANLHHVNEGKFYTVGVSIGVSAWEDPNLFRHDAMLDYLEQKLKPESKLPLIDPDTGAVSGWLISTNGTSVMPLLKTDTRSLSFVMVSFQTSQTSQTSQTG